VEAADTAWAATTDAGVAGQATVGEAGAGTEADASVGAGRVEEADDAAGDGAGTGVALRSSGDDGRRPASAARIEMASGRASTDACAADHSQPASARGPA